MKPAAELRAAGMALLVAAAAFALSCLPAPPQTHSLSFGATYEAMSLRPLAFTGLFPHRILLPLLANLCGLQGTRFYLAAHASAVLLLALVYWGSRRLGGSTATAMLVTLATALGGATQLYKSHVGYPDSLTFLFLLAAALAVRHTRTFWAMNMLGMLAHEQVFFFLPFLLLLRARIGGARRRTDVLGTGAMLLLYGAFRAVVDHYAEPGAIRPGFYFGNGYLPLGFLGVLYLAMMETVLVFGATLPVLAWAVAVRRVAWERLALLLFVAGIVGIYVVAHDFNRFVNFLFLPLGLASLRFLQRPGHRLVFVGMLLLQVAVGLWLAQPVIDRLVPPMLECHCLSGVPGDLRKLVTYVLPRAWPTVASLLLALLALLGLGVWLARRQRGHGDRSGI